VSSPGTTTKVYPKSVLRIDGDPTLWGLRDFTVDPGKPPPWSTQPVLLDLIAPLVGTLVLSPRAGGFAIFPPTPADGWMPGMRIEFPYLYLPTTAGVHSSSPIYELAQATTASDIAAAMQSGDSLPLRFTSVGQPSWVVINGATLAFAVLG